MKDRIARSLFWVVWSRGAVQVVSLFSTLVVARLLNPLDYGLMALMGSWTYAIATIAELGLGFAIIQFPDLEERELNTCFWLVAGTMGVGYLTLYASAPAIATWFGIARLTEVLRVAGLSLPLLAVRTVPDALLRKRLELDRISQSETASVVVAVPVVVGLAWSGAGVWALVAGTLVTLLVQDIVTCWFAGWRPSRQIGSRRLREILRYSMAALGAKVGWSVYQQIDAVVLGKISGGTVLGFYWMAKVLATLAVDKISVIANQLTLPIMAGLQTDRGAMRDGFLRALRLVACLTCPLCLGTALLADDLVSVAFTDKWHPMVPLLQVLCVFGLVRSIDVLLPPVLFARYRAAFVFGWTVVLLLVMPLAVWTGVTVLSALGVALAMSVVYPILMCWMAREALRELGIGVKALWHELRPITIAILLMAPVVLAVRWTIPGSDVVDRVARLGLAGSLGALVYAAAILRFGGPLVPEIAKVTGWLFPRWSSPTLAK